MNRIRILEYEIAVLRMQELIADAERKRIIYRMDRTAPISIRRIIKNLTGRQYARITKA